MKSYYIAKVLHKLRISSFRKCKIDATAKIDSECTLSEVVMGRYSYVGARTRITGAIIGGFCSIGSCCGIGGGIHPTGMVSTSPVFLQGHNILGKHFANIEYDPSKTVVIGNDVWIGENACILSGVKVGNGAIIGAHAVVTKDVEPYTIVAGIPAKKIKNRFDKEIIDQLLEIEWWNWSDDMINKMAHYFNSPNELIKAVVDNKGEQ